MTERSRRCPVDRLSRSCRRSSVISGRSMHERPDCGPPTEHPVHVGGRHRYLSLPRRWRDRTVPQARSADRSRQSVGCMGGRLTGRSPARRYRDRFRGSTHRLDGRAVERAILCPNNPIPTVLLGHSRRPHDRHRATGYPTVTTALRRNTPCIARRSPGGRTPAHGPRRATRTGRTCRRSRRRLGG